MRCFRVKELEQVWDTWSRTEGRPAFGESDEKILMGTARNNVGSGKSEFLAKHCVGNYDIEGGRWFSASITRRAIRGGTSAGDAESIDRMGA